MRFDGMHTHASDAFTGDRWSMVFSSTDGCTVLRVIKSESWPPWALDVSTHLALP